MFNGERFALAREGLHAAVQVIFKRIQRDTRHSDLRGLAFDRCRARSFAHWSMAYVGDAGNAAPFADIATASAFDPSNLDGDAIHDVLKANMADSALV